jgi:hypothetical protein
MRVFRNISVLFFLLVIATDCFAQNEAVYIKLKSIKADIVNFSIDNLDNIYIVNSSNQIKKLNSNGDSVGVFNDVKKYGKLTSIDASNPLRVLLFYKDFGIIVVLDRFLNIRNSIDLRKQNIYLVKSISQSFDNNIWLYDELENKLKKIDDEGKILLETPDFRQLFGAAASPIKIFDQDRLVYLYDTLKGVFVFDYFGTLKNKILITGWKDFKVVGKFIFGVNNDTLYRYQIDAFRYDEEILPQSLSASLKLDFSSSRIYALKKDELELYELKK